MKAHKNPKKKKQLEERAFSFVPMNTLPKKPRKRGITEIRGPYYTVMGKRYLKDVMETMGPYIDSLKFAGGSFSLIPKDKLKEIIDLAHQYDVMVSTGGFIEYVLTKGASVVDDYIKECKNVGFDILEISSGFITYPIEDWLRLIEKVKKAGLKPKPEVGIQFGAGGATKEESMEATRDVGHLIDQAERFLEAGAYMLMIESEGITENVKKWRTDVISSIINTIGLEKTMFEAADPDVFGWYIKNYGPEVNLFVDHSQIVELSCMRHGIWGTNDMWGRIVTYKSP